MKKKRSIKLDNIVSDEAKSVKAAVVINREITSDFVLEIYEKSKRARSAKKKDEWLAIADELSKHVGKYLVK